MWWRTYEITFAGQAGATVCTPFHDCEITTGPGTITLRAELPDHAAVMELLERIAALGLELMGMRLVAPPPGAITDGMLGGPIMPNLCRSSAH